MCVTCVSYDLEPSVNRPWEVNRLLSNYVPRCPLWLLGNYPTANSPVSEPGYSVVFVCNVKQRGFTDNAFFGNNTHHNTFVPEILFVLHYKVNKKLLTRKVELISPALLVLCFAVGLHRLQVSSFKVAEVHE